MTTKIMSSANGTKITVGTSAEDILELDSTAKTVKLLGTYSLVATNHREVLTAARIYYVRTDGSDSNTGLANTSGGAFLTIQKAVDVVCFNLDCNGYLVTIQVGDGTYTAGFNMRPVVGFTSLTVQGNSTTPANVFINITGTSPCVNNTVPGVVLNVDGFKLASSGGIGMIVTGGGRCSFKNIDFGTCATAHVYVRDAGSVASAASNYTISGNTQVHLYALDQAGHNCEGRTITLSGTRDFSSCFYYVRTVAYITCNNAVYSGSATGPRYYVSAGGVIYTSGQTLPGNVGGTVGPSGIYL